MIGGRLDRGVELQATHRLAVRGDEAGEHRATLLDGRDAAIEILLGHMALQEPLEPEHRIRIGNRLRPLDPVRPEEHTSELPSLMRISYAVFCLEKTIC